MRFHFILLFALFIRPAFAQFNKQYPGIGNDSLPIPQDLYITNHEALRSRPLTLRKALTVPVALTIASLYSLSDNENLSKFEVKEERDEWAPHFHHNADDYLQYAPIAVVYGLNLIGVNGKNDFVNRTALLVKSELLVAAIVYPLKKITAEPRPDTGERNAFPSGHTAQAFAAATFMAREYGHVSLWYIVGAYTVATTVGAMRILNDRHWVTDVLAGAGIGVLSTNLVYLTHCYKWVNKHHHNLQTLVVPSYDGHAGMLSVVTMLH